MNAYSQYQQNQVLSATPEQILIMLYDGAIRFTRQAMYGLEEENLAIFHHGIQKTLAIISEFSNSLDHESGGQIAVNLDSLYTFMIRQLTLANLHKNIENLQVVERLLVDLRATWEEAVEMNKGDMLEGKKQLTPHSTVYSPPRDYVPLSISR